MRAWFSPAYTVAEGSETFPTRKFELTAKALLADGTLRPEELAAPDLPTPSELLRAHTPEWVAKAVSGGLTPAEEALLELRWSPALATAHRLCVRGTLEACRDALGTGLGLHVGGGSHHAFADHGEGYCLLNDLAAAVLELQATRRVSRAAVVDLDVHQGNGTASILAGRPGLYTLSLHQEGGYPSVKVLSTRDVALPAGTGDAKYLKILEEELLALLARRPELVVYQAGVDVWEGDLLGGLALSAEGVAARDRLVFRVCRERGVPVAVTLGGGYAERVSDAAALHARTLRIGMESFK
ncbi:MAG: histone deacetylase [Elusimicrobia bacterium]|nr:histone deacetylase [Elusimicrobiota bacterium]